MKILFSPIYTGRVHKCASAVKFRRLAEAIISCNQLQTHNGSPFPETFIYWCIPDNLKEEELKWLPDSPYIKYIAYPQDTDRYKEYRRVSYPEEKVYSFLGDYWDWDIAVTNKTSSLPTLNALANHHNYKQRELKPILLIEDFPLMKFKSAAAVTSTTIQDMYTVLGYQTAAETYICAYWEKALILDSARAYLSYSELRRLQSTIIECHPYPLQRMLALKTQEAVLKQSQPETPFTIVFAGRMVNGHKFDKIFNIMGQNWILKSKSRPIEAVVCTQSASDGKVDVPDYVTINKFNRDQFWEFMKTKASVGLFFSNEEDYSLSLIEPLMMGVPYAVYRAPWSVASLGPEYPFYFQTEQEAYTIVKAFHDDYVNNYLTFAGWHQNHFKPLIKHRDQITIPSQVLPKLQAIHASHLTTPINQDPTSIPQLLLGALQSIAKTSTTEKPGKDDLSTPPQTPPKAYAIPELILEASKTHEIRSLIEKFERPDQMKIDVVFASDRYFWKKQLLAAGVKEAIEPGTYYLP